MSFLYGVLSATLLLCTFAGGAFLGWKAHGIVGEKMSVRAAEELTEDKRKQLRDEQEAFRKLQNYTVEDAYGLNRDFLKEYSEGQ